jgi:uncharacterized membrane protein YbhN (UPF0104 family)
VTPRTSRARRTGFPPAGRLLRWALGALAMALLVVALVRQGPGVVEALRNLDAWSVAAAAAAVLVALVTNMLSWHAHLAGMGSRLPVPAAARLYFLAQLGKYLPGSVWPLLAQMDLGREHRLPAARSAAAAGLNVVLNLTTGILLGLVGLALSGSGGLEDYWWVLLLVPLFLVLLHPPVLNRCTAIALRLLRRPVVETRLTLPALLQAIAWSAAMWIALGLNIAALAHGVGAEGGRLLLLSTGAYAIAWVIGFIVVFAPAGAGPREIALVVLLAPVLPQPAALAVALVSRALGIVGDLVVVAVAMVAEWFHRQHAEVVISLEEAKTPAAERAAGQDDDGLRGRRRSPDASP